MTPTPHIHTEECLSRPEGCSRKVDLVPDDSVTDALEIKDLHRRAKAAGRPPRKTDPKWTRILQRAALKALMEGIKIGGIAAVLFLLWLAQLCGVHVPWEKIK